VSNEFQRHINRLYEYSSTRSGSRGETRGQWEHNSPGAESLWGRRMTAGGDEKSNQCHKYFLQYSTFASERFQARTWGRQTIPSCPRHHLISFRPCLEDITSQGSFINVFRILQL